MAGKAPRPVLIIPGFMCDARAFAPFVASISCERAVQVATAVVGETIEDMAGAILAHAPPEFALIGHGLGGVVAMEIAAQAAERVDRLALMGTNPLKDAPSQAGAREERIVIAKGGRVADAALDEISSDSLAPGLGKLRVQADIRSMADALGSGVFERQARALMRRKDRQRSLREFRMPTKIIAGRHDAWSPVRRHEFMAELIPDAEFEVIEDAGHYPMLEAPEALNASLNGWLKGALLLL
ncbi:MAG: alpha/beta hydrolase [Pseudomonadota bacterium]